MNYYLLFMNIMFHNKGSRYNFFLAGIDELSESYNERKNDLITYNIVSFKEMCYVRHNIILKYVLYRKLHCL